ncbi:MAG: hypothetical protein QOK33_724 [Mycobacterium sp.]|nr:hypothetical protein [Mycobacterium sp.]
MWRRPKSARVLSDPSAMVIVVEHLRAAPPAQGRRGAGNRAMRAVTATEHVEPAREMG